MSVVCIVWSTYDESVLRLLLAQWAQQRKDISCDVCIWSCGCVVAFFSGSGPPRRYHLLAVFFLLYIGSDSMPIPADQST